MSRGRALGAALTLVVAAGCTGAPADDDGPRSDEAATSSGTTTEPASDWLPDDVVGGGLDLDAAVPLAEATGIGTPQPLPPDSGLVRVALSTEEVVTQDGRDEPGRVTLRVVRPSDGRTLTEIVSPGGDDVANVGSVAADERWIVWTETTSTDPFTNPWRMFSYDRTSGVVREIARAQVPDGVPFEQAGRAYGDTELVLVGDRVYYGARSPAARPDVLPRESTDVWSVALTGSEQRLEVERGYGPVVHGDEIIAARALGIDEDEVHEVVAVPLDAPGSPPEVLMTRHLHLANLQVSAEGDIWWQARPLLVDATPGLNQDAILTSPLDDPDEARIVAEVEGSVVSSGGAARATYLPFVVSRATTEPAQYLYLPATGELVDLRGVTVYPSGSDETVLWRDDATGVFSVAALA